MKEYENKMTNTKNTKEEKKILKMLRRMREKKKNVAIWLNLIDIISTVSCSTAIT